MSGSRPITVDANTQLSQQQASNPEHSAWVSANAGSGKTTVLARRVVRLLLGGTDPSRILCLTFTKAAAGEMTNRVFAILGKWAVLPQEQLIEALTREQGKRPTQQELALARTLFARALETPGGLKIQTIHAFCEALLHQFPLEANVPGNFSVMDDAAQNAMVRDARRAVLLQAHDEPSSEIGQAFAAVMEVASDTAIDKVFSDIIRLREPIADWLDATGGPDAAEQAARRALGFSPEDTTESLGSALVGGSVFQTLDRNRLIDLCRKADTSTMITLADNLESFSQSTDEEERLALLTRILLTSKGEPRAFSKFPTNAVADAWPGIRDIFSQEALRVKAGLAEIQSLRTIINTTSLLVIARSIIARYRRSKRQAAQLDFDDLVSATADLLTRREATSWVLYKLDLGIDHILVDEAQDTSPRQWQIISALVEEFFTSNSARSANRTVFAVGDEKQSIFSFQGAEPKSFVEQRRKFVHAAGQVGKSMPSVRLNLSFRSTADVLGAVDRVFGVAENADGLSFEGGYEGHTSARRHDPGSVEVWELQEPIKADDPQDWHMPQDQNQSQHQAVLLANRVAGEIRGWIDEGRIEASGRRITAGDILILVRARDRFMNALNRALKDRGIPVAGVDRLVLTNHIAVKDLLALGQVMLTPDDDLALAAILKSPMLALTEEELLRLARARLHERYEVSLFDSLRHLAGKGEEPFRTANEKLERWRDRADAMPVYEFYARLLGADGARRAFYGRLGAEAEDILDAFLERCLGYEQAGLPGLQAFIETLLRDSPEIKRELDQAAGQVRVMTVHAAKGLEAPIVFLVDKCSAAQVAQHSASLYRWGDAESPGGFLWVPKKDQHGAASEPLRLLEKRMVEQEYRRLLYVAMTRARDRLIVCGYRGQKLPSGPNWHTMVREALQENWQPVETGEGELAVYRWTVPQEERETPLPPEHHDDEAPVPARAAHTLPGWVRHRLPAEPALPRPLSPSGAQALIDEALTEPLSIPSLLGERDTTGGQTAADRARRRGTVVHKLLQVLPDMQEEGKWDRARNYLLRMLPDFLAKERESLLQGVASTLGDEKLGPYFDPATSRAEVPVMGRLDLASGPRPVSGTIDRLAVLDDHIMLLDYKTGAPGRGGLQDVSADYITQMALYRALVAKLYPQRSVRAALVWTQLPVGNVMDETGPRFMALPDDVLDAAFRKISQL